MVRLLNGDCGVSMHLKESDGPTLWTIQRDDRLVRTQNTSSGSQNTSLSWGNGCRADDVAQEKWSVQTQNALIVRTVPVNTVTL